MPKYTKEFTEKVLHATDIVKIIGAYTPLTQENDVLVGPSPFDKDKRKTLVVYPQTQTFKDFGSKESGNVFVFVSHKSNLTYDRAIEVLAKKANIQITDADLYKDPAKTTKKTLLSIMEAATNYYCNQMKTTGGKLAKDYVTERGLTEETTQKFKLGYAPGNGTALCNYLKSQGYPMETIVSSGLVRVADGKPYDYFRNRLMFPIWNKDGQVVAFTGRTLDGHKPKYVNSFESPIFNKSEILYGMNLAKNTNKPYYILVEGQMDTIKLHQAGFDNVVAISGTAFTEKHCEQLSTRIYKGKEKQMSGLMIATDGDEAGQKAKMRIIKRGQEHLPFGMRVVEWPADCKDPDEVLSKKGAKFFDSCLVNSMMADNYVVKALYEKTHDYQQVCDEFVKNFSQRLEQGMKQEDFNQRMNGVLNTLASANIDNSEHEIERA